MSTVVDRRQPTFDDLEPTLRETTFVVVDLETTGGSSRRSGITEIGAVKVRGGEVLGEFSTLVRPDQPIPPHIVLLTNITNEMVADAPTEDAVIPAFLEFARGAVLVAHNAPFDIGFLREACARLELAWPPAVVLDTVRLARSVFSKAELPSVRLGVLARALGARVTPNHRALADARATVDVLHGLMERLGPLGVVTLGDIVDAQRAVEPARRRKSHLADGIPAAPGVYLFRSAAGEVLYVGTSGNLRSRVRSYFTAAETRGRIKEMVLRAGRVDVVVCASRLEAAIRELRLIAAHQPPYNRRSKRRVRPYWLRVGPAPQCRLTLVDTLRDTEDHAFGPFPGRSAGRAVIDAIRSARAATILASEGPNAALAALRDRMASLAAAGQYDVAALVRDQLAAVGAQWARTERLLALTAIAELIVARPDGSGGWELTVVRRGQLCAADRAPRGVDPMPVVESLVASAQTVRAATPLAEETALILAYLERPEVRIVRSSSAWMSPVGGVGRWRGFADQAALARESIDLVSW